MGELEENGYRTTSVPSISGEAQPLESSGLLTAKSVTPVFDFGVSPFDFLREFAFRDWAPTVTLVFM